MLKKFIAAIAIGMVAIASQAAPWESHSYVDAMSNKTIQYKATSSNETLDFGFPYKGDNYGILRVAIAQPKVGTTARFEIKKGIITGDQIIAKFDDEKPQQWSYTTMADGSKNVVSINNAPAFIAKVRKAKVIKIEFTAFHQGSPVVTFEGMGQ